MSEAPAGLEHWAMRLSPKIHQILDILSDGRFHSGELIGQAIGISRERVSVYIRELRSKGVQVFSLQRKGYSLPAPAELLDEKRLNESLGGARIECVVIIDSTNSYLLARINESESGECVLAEMQTAGRGRRGHTWVSPFASQFICSMCWKFDSFDKIQGLSLAAGLAQYDVLSELGYRGMMLKWPNDIYAQGRKLSGTLIECSGTEGNGCALVSGTGINLRRLSGVQIDQPWISLEETEFEGNARPTRMEITGGIIVRTRQYFREFSESGFAVFRDRWNEKCLYLNEPVMMLDGSNVAMRGVCRGVDDIGRLLLETKDRGLVHCMAGVLSLRPDRG